MNKPDWMTPAWCSKTKAELDQRAAEVRDMGSERITLSNVEVGLLVNMAYIGCLYHVIAPRKLSPEVQALNEAQLFRSIACLDGLINGGLDRVLLDTAAMLSTDKLGEFLVPANLFEDDQNDTT